MTICSNVAVERMMARTSVTEVTGVPDRLELLFAFAASTPIPLHTEGDSDEVTSVIVTNLGKVDDRRFTFLGHLEGDESTSLIGTLNISSGTGNFEVEE